MLLELEQVLVINNDLPKVIGSATATKLLVILPHHEDNM